MQVHKGIQFLHQKRTRSSDEEYNTGIVVKKEFEKEPQVKSTVQYKLMEMFRTQKYFQRKEPKILIKQEPYYETQEEQIYIKQKIKREPCNVKEEPDVKIKQEFHSAKEHPHVQIKQECSKVKEDLYRNNALDSQIKCYQCNNPIENSQIKVTCELCGNRIHFHCLSLSLYMILKRSYYLTYYKDLNKTYRGENKKYFLKNDSLRIFKSLLKAFEYLEEPKIKIFKNQKELYRNIISNIQKQAGYIENNNESLLDHLFTVCNNCKNRKHLKLNVNKLYECINYNLRNYSDHPSLNLHELFMPEDFINKDKAKPYTHLKKPIIKRIIKHYPLADGSNRCYYIIKWFNSIYSCELSEFMSLHPSFQNTLNEYDSEDAIPTEAPNENLFINQLTLFKKPNQQYDYNSIGQNILYFYEKSAKAEKAKHNFLFQFLHSIYTSSRTKPKILICTDDPNIKLTLKNKSQINSSTFNITSLKSHSAVEKIVYELISFEINYQPTTLLFQTLLSILDNKNNAEISQFLNDSKINLNALNVDVLVISPSTLSMSKVNHLLLSFKFNLFIFDAFEGDLETSFDMISELKQKNDINKDSLIYLFGESTDIPYSFTAFIRSKIIYTDNYKLLFNKNSTLGHSKQIVNKNIINFPCDGSVTELLNSILTRFNWSVNFDLIKNIGKRTFDLDSIKTQMKCLFAEKSLLDMNVNYKKTICIFISVSFERKASDKYYGFITNINNTKKYSQNNVKWPNAAVLNDLCTFPYIEKEADNTNYYIAMKEKYKIALGKLAVLNKLINIVGYKGHRIMILYSLNDKTDPSYFYHIRNQIMPQNSNYNICIYDISDPCITSELEQDKFLYVILLNSFAFDQIGGSLLNKIFSRNQMIIFQLYITNTFEHSLLKEYYCYMDHYDFNKNNISLDDVLKIGNYERSNYSLNHGKSIFDCVKDINYYLYFERYDDNEDNVIIKNNNEVVYCGNIQEFLDESDTRSDYKMELDHGNKGLLGSEIKCDDIQKYECDDDDSFDDYDESEMKDNQQEVSDYDRDDDDNNDDIEMKSDIKKNVKIKQEIKQEIKPEIKPKIKPEIKQEIKPEIKQKIKPKIKQEIKQEIKPEIKQEIKPEIKQENKDENKNVTKIKYEPKNAIKQEIEDNSQIKSEDFQNEEYECDDEDSIDDNDYYDESKDDDYDNNIEMNYDNKENIKIKQEIKDDMYLKDESKEEFKHDIKIKYEPVNEIKQEIEDNTQKGIHIKTELIQNRIVKEDIKDPHIYDDNKHNAHKYKTEAKSYILEDTKPKIASNGQIRKEPIENANSNNSESKARNSIPTYTDCLISMTSNVKQSIDKVIGIENLLFSNGFTNNLRETLLYLILDKGLGLEILLSEQTQQGLKNKKMIIKNIQKEIFIHHDIRLSPELILIYIEYFIYSLIYHTECKTAGHFVFLNHDTLAIKSQLLLTYLNNHSQNNLFQAIKDDNMLKKYNLDLTKNNKIIIKDMFRRVLDDCKEKGFNDYISYIQKHASNCFRLGLVPIKRGSSFSTQDYYNEREFAELIENLYTDLFNSMVD